MQIEVWILDYTNLQKRASKLQVALNVKPITGARDIVIDSTGLKVFGDGEWKDHRMVIGLEHGRATRDRCAAAIDQDQAA